MFRSFTNLILQNRRKRPNATPLRGALMLVLAAALSVAAAGASSAAALYGTNAGGQFITIDPATGATTLIGNTGVTALGAAYNPNTNTLYIRDFGNLYTVDQTTGARTLVGPSGNFITGLTFNASYSTLYSVNQGSGELYAVNPMTGAATFVGNTGISTPLDLSTDTSGTVYVGSIAGDLFTINTATGAAVKVGSIGASLGLTSIAFDATNVLYGVTLNGELLYRDLLGTPTLVGALLPGYRDVRGLAFAAVAVPEPASLALFGAGLLGLAAIRRGRKRGQALGTAA
jgi:hypothetical protein